jgi:hypothetical protein
MSTVRGEGRGPQQSRFWREGALGFIDLALITATAMLMQFTLAHFSWFQRFTEHHGIWASILLSWVGFMLVMHFFRRKQRLKERAVYRMDLRHGRVARMSLASRCTVMLIALTLVVASTFVQNSYGRVCLLLGVPALMLFALEELIIILRPGNFVFPDPHDELLAFFRARTLQVGYSIAILSLAALYLVNLFATRYLSLLLPIMLAISLLAPALFYSRLDRRAGANE